MRNRLIQKLTKSRKGTPGYTLTEMLVVIAIVVVLLAIAIPSVISLSRSLKFAQRNDYAKSIFMAAQANLTEMRADGGLAPLQGENVNSRQVREELCGFPVEDWSPEYVYTASDLTVLAGQKDTYALVLPVGSVDGTLREQQVIIEYNPLTGNVYSVFYFEGDVVGDTGRTLLDLYTGSELPRNGEGDEKKRKELMVGYYDGSGLSSAELEIERTQAQIVFENGEEGIVTVMVPMPDLYVGSHNEFMKGLEVKLTVTGEISGGRVENILVKAKGTVGENCKLDVDGKTVLVTYVLDSLANRMSFANLASHTRPAENAAQSMGGGGRSLTTLMSESELTLLPGENVVLDAEVTFHAADDRPNVAVQNATLGGVNPMFGYLTENLSDDKYTLTIDNGRNLQNLNAIAPSVAEKISAVLFTSDIYWNRTVAYYNQNYGTAGAYTSMADEAPARALPYFVPIHNENLFGTARFIFMDGSEEGESFLQTILGWLIGSDFKRNDRVPTLTDEVDSVKDASGKYVPVPHATIDGGGYGVYYLNINSNLYQVPNAGNATTKGKFYATGENQIIDYYFTGLFGYVNTPISDLRVVNPVIKGHDFEDTTSGGKTNYSNPATGALVGACGFNTYLYNCSSYLDTKADGFNWSYAEHGTVHPQTDFAAAGDQKWYGVSGAGAVGGLVGYAKSHRTTNGAMSDDSKVLAFNRCFAAVPVSGTMRGNGNKDFGYSNGVGGLIGNSQLTNFYNCYASGNVRVSNTYAQTIDNQGADTLQTVLGLGGNGRLSMGGGGFVGTSHGTRYTNCFSTSNVTRISGNGTMVNAGGFVGMMCYDETKAYGHHSGSTSNTVAQHTVFENCYAAGMCIDGNGNYLESFAGGTGTINVSYGTIASYYSPDYYRLFAPYFVRHGADPQYQTHYIFKDSFYLSQYRGNANVGQDHSKKCANPIGYSDLVNLHLKYGDNTWIQGNIDNLKKVPLDAQVFRTLITTLDDLFNKGGLFGGLKSLWEIWDLFMESDQNYQFYFTLYEYLVKEEVRPATPTLEQRLFTRYSAGFPSLPWETPVERNTHYYGESTAGMVFPFPKINGLDYYGTWSAEPLTGGLAYYEAYDTANGRTYGYYFDRADTSSLWGTEETVILHDGYAVFSGTKNDKIRIFDASGNLLTKDGALTPDQYAITLSSPFSPDNSSYYVTRIPEAIFSNLTPGGEGFYSAIRIEVSNDSGTGYYWALFNPNTGISQVNNVQFNGNNIVYQENPEDVMIRTARQLNAITSTKMQNVWNDPDVTFIQQLHINAATYDWNNDGNVLNETIPVPGSIGSEAKPFCATYTGSAGYVDQAKIEGFAFENPIFGNIGNGTRTTQTTDETTTTTTIIQGKVEDLSILIQGGENVTIGGENAQYAAVLAAVSSGIIDNVDIRITGALKLEANTAAGLLVGYVNGTEEDPAVISGCDTTVENMTVTAENAGAVLGLAEYCDVKSGLDSENLADDVSLTLTELTLTATEAGGFLGSGLETNLDGLVITLASVDSTAVRTGALVGTLDKGSIRNMTVVLDGTYEAQHEEQDALIAGVAAVAKNATVQNVNVTISGTVTGDSAAGVFGTAMALTVQTTEVTVTGTITGDAAAAGMAVSIEGGNFTAAAVNLKGTVTAQGTEEVTTEDTTAEDGTVIPGTTTIEPAGRAAGYAVAVKGQVESGLVLAEEQAVITGSKEAAGFACEITSQVTGSRVAGYLTINGGEKAAGFAVKLAASNLSVSANGVTPALENTTAGYLNNSNDNLTVNAETAAMFAVEIGQNVNVTNCYALGTVSGSVISGFADTNLGVIDGSTANVTISGGYAFVRDNVGSVSNCYGWYGNDEFDADVPVEESATMAVMEGSVVSSYFIDLDVPALYLEELATMTNADKYRSAVIYDSAKGLRRTTPLDPDFEAKLLNGQDGSRWFASGTYGSFPYSKLVPVSYPFPMLRVHYGDWATPPRYAFGVVYYEKYENNTWKLRIEDLSDPDVTVETGTLTGYYTISDQGRVYSATNIFNNDASLGAIVESGYAAFYKDTLEDMNLLDAQWGDHLTLRISDKTVYTLRRVTPVKVDGQVIAHEILSYPELDENGNETSVGKTIVIGANYAHEFNLPAGNPHVVRTETQLQKVAATGSYLQTHDIVLSYNFATITGFAGDYNGGNCLIQKPGTANAWMNGVSGTVRNVDLVLGDLNASFFGDVSGSVSLNEVYLASVGAQGSLINSFSGKLSFPTVEVDGILAGTIIRNAAADLTMTVKPDLIPAGGAAIGTVSGGTVNLTLEYAQGGDMGGSLVNAVTGGTFNLVNDPAFGTVSGNLLGAVSGTVNLNSGITVDTLSGVLVGTMNEGAAVNTNAVRVTNLNASLVYDFTGGTLSGTQVNVTNGIAVPVFADTLGGTVKDYTVSGTVTLGGNAKGALVNTNNGTLDGLTLASGTVTVTAAEDAAIGVLAGTNGGTIRDCIVEGAEVTITGTEDKHLTFGGLVGENAGTITGDNEIEADITYIQPVDGDTDKATIGGLVGKMSGGTLENAYVTGSIGLTNQEQLDAAAAIAKAEEQGIELIDEPNPAPIDSNRSYIIGGAVGEDGDKTAQYTGVTTNVHVNDNWAVDGEVSYIMPAGRGAVGKFVGYVNNGVFTDCSATNSNGTYMFLGEILLNTATLENDGDAKTNWYTSASSENSTSGLNGGKDVQGVYDSYGYTREGETFTYSFYSAKLSNCGFLHTDGIEYFQTFDDTYIYQGTENQLEVYTANRFGTRSYVEASGLKYNDFTSGNGEYKDTNYFYKVDNVYYKVVVTRESRKSGRTTYYTFTLYYEISEGVYSDAIHKSAEIADYRTAYEGPQLYTIVDAAIPSGSAMYMIVSSDGAKALDANGNAVTFQTSFNKDENADLYGAIWQTSGPKAQWQNLSDTGRYLYLEYVDNWIVSDTIRVTHTSGRNITVSQNSYDENGFALFRLSYEQSSYSRDGLRYSNGKFTVADGYGHEFQIYLINTDGKVWKADFVLQTVVDQVIVARAADGTELDFSTSTASIESDLPADSGEATQGTEVPEATGSNETATVPPTAEDGNNN